MGQHDIHVPESRDELRGFMKYLLEDLRALELMIEQGAFETDVRRIGAEQEFFLCDPGFQPGLTALQVLERLDHPQVTTELGLFNLEVNLNPQVLEGHCLSRMEDELTTLLAQIRSAAEKEGSQVVLTGILPTLEKTHLGLDSMTPLPRYHRLSQIMRDLRGGEFRTYIKGLDTLQMTHDNVMLEACNTSFQIHFQVNPGEFAPLYNLAQVVTAPVLAAAVNSPVLLRHRLWHETRVALFEQSVDTRSETHTRRGGRSRVSFGQRWVDDSVLEIFRQDIARFRVLMTAEVRESPLEILERGEVPDLRCLCIHNGTVYRWNRPCYGVQDGTPHLRIENRVLPAGPSVLDELANAAFYYGLMCSLSHKVPDVTERIRFDDAKSNFMAAARYGLGAQLRWLDGQQYGADELVLKLMDEAREGLVAHGIAPDDIERYLPVLEERVRSGTTGAEWALRSLAHLGDRGSADERYRSLTHAMIQNQERGIPVHRWEPAELTDNARAWRESCRTVGQVMKTDLFTVDPEDLIDLAASLMDWKHIRHVPVEDPSGRLLGVLSHRHLLRILAQGRSKPTAVKEVMATNPITVTPETTTLEAIQLMREHGVSCLPVVDGERLVGIVTERDFVLMAARVFEKWLGEE